MDTPSGIKDSIPAWIKFSVQAPGEIPYNGIYYDPPEEVRNAIWHQIWQKNVTSVLVHLILFFHVWSKNYRIVFLIGKVFFQASSTKKATISKDL